MRIEDEIFVQCKCQIKGIKEGILCRTSPQSSLSFCKVLEDIFFLFVLFILISLKIHIIVPLVNEIFLHPQLNVWNTQYLISFRHIFLWEWWRSRWISLLAVIVLSRTWIRLRGELRWAKRRLLRNRDIIYLYFDEIFVGLPWDRSRISNIRI